MTEPTDEELVERFQKGDQHAFRSLVLRYQEKVWWNARRVVGNDDDAADVAQEVFCKAYEALARFRGDATLYTWLYRITVNLGINHLRRTRLRQFFRIDDLLDVEEDPAAAPDKLLETNEERKIIEEGIALLPAKQKAVFLMRYYDELPYEEISRITGTSVGGLKANYFHAVKKIGDHLRRAHTSR